MRVDVRPRKRNAPRPAEKSAPGYLQWLRGRNCLLARLECGGKGEAAHVDYAGGKGVGTKVADRFAIPLCTLHHRAQHECGWKTFEAFYRFDALQASKEYWAKWPGRIAWERKLEARDG